jgi:hypothetical protein
VSRRAASGVLYDAFRAFEDDLNKERKSKAIKTHVVYLPVGRDEIISRLVDGWGDVIFADLTITPERRRPDTRLSRRTPS